MGAPWDGHIRSWKPLALARMGLGIEQECLFGYEIHGLLDIWRFNSRHPTCK